MRYLLSLGIIFLSISTLLANDSLENLLQKADGIEKADLLLQLSYTHFKEDKSKGFHSARSAYSIYRGANDSEKKAEAMKVIAVLHQRSNVYDSALYYYRHAIDHIKKPDALAKIFDNVGIIYQKLALYDSSLYYHQNARKLQATIGAKAGVAYSLNNIGNVYLKKREYEKSLEYYQKSLKIREEQGVKSDMAASYLNIGRAYTQMNQYEDALLYLQRALQIRMIIDDPKLIAYSYNSIGNFYLQLKIYDKAREHYNKALLTYQRIESNSGISSAYNNIGTVHRELGNYEKALEYYTKALDLRQQEGLTSAEAYSLNNIGGLFWHKKEYNKAVEYYQKALELRKRIGNKLLIAHSYKSLGMVHKDKELYDEALNFYEKAMEAFMEESDMESIAYIQNLKGNLFRKQKAYDKANEYYSNAIEIYRQLNNEQGVASTANNIGITYLEWGKLKNAIPAFEEAIQIADKLLNKNLKKEASLSLSELYETTKDFDKSLYYFQQYSALKDSIHASESSKRIAEIEFENDLMVKDHEIAKQEFSLKEKDQRIGLQRIIIFIVIVVAIVIMIMLKRISDAKKKQIKINNQLEKAKKELTQSNQTLVASEISLTKEKKKVTDSIAYAKKIQDAILPSIDTFQEVIPQSFVYFQPLDVVSGDFYWLHTIGSKKYVVVADCTGHGIPGAFMSMIGNTLLNEIVIGKQITDPAQILTELDKGVITALKQDSSNLDKQEDGMEVSMCVIDSDTNEIEFAGTDQKIYLVKGASIQSYSGNIFPIGGMVKLKKKKQIPYETHKLSVEKGMTLYMLSDGYIDQFGGEDDQRFSSGRLQELLIDIQNLDMMEQYNRILQAHRKWKGKTAQIDDVLVVGIRF